MFAAQTRGLPLPFQQENLPHKKCEFNSVYTISHLLQTCVFGPKVSIDPALEDGDVEKRTRKDI